MSDMEAELYSLIHHLKKKKGEAAPGSQSAIKALNTHKFVQILRCRQMAIHW